jgi:hypothetical protein
VELRPGDQRTGGVLPQPLPVADRLELLLGQPVEDALVDVEAVEEIGEVGQAGRVGDTDLPAVHADAVEVVLLQVVRVLPRTQGHLPGGDRERFEVPDVHAQGHDARGLLVAVLPEVEQGQAHRVFPRREGHGEGLGVLGEGQGAGVVDHDAPGGQVHGADVADAHRSRPGVPGAREPASGTEEVVDAPGCEGTRRCPGGRHGSAARFHRGPAEPEFPLGEDGVRPQEGGPVPEGRGGQRDHAGQFRVRGTVDRRQAAAVLRLVPVEAAPTVEGPDPDGPVVAPVRHRSPRGVVPLEAV